MKVLGVIPARGGSKGVPRKNIRLLAGRPLIAFTIEACRQARLLTRFVVSTDDSEVARVAKGLGAEVVNRPAALATDDAPTEGALLHALDALEAHGFQADAVATLEPTSPLRSAATIDRCIERLSASAADAVVTVVEDRSYFGRVREGTFVPLFPGQARRRQDREPLFRESSTVWVTRVAALRSSRRVLGTSAIAVTVEQQEATDINDMLDFSVAEAILQSRVKENANA